jgi:hypothetical protein
MTLEALETIGHGRNEQPLPLWVGQKNIGGTILRKLEGENLFECRRGQKWLLR